MHTQLREILLLNFENKNNNRTTHTVYYLPKVEIKDYNVKIDGKNLFDQPINNDNKTHENIRKIATGQGDDYTIRCLFQISLTSMITIR